MNHFKGVDAREKYDFFFAKVLKVKDFAVLTFADLAQRHLVDYIRDVLLQPEAAEWFSTWWTGARGRYCLAHAGYGGSNNNMGVEVDWRDAKGLVPSSATIGAYAGALVKFVADICTEHQTFLKPTDGLFPSTGVMTKRIYEITISCRSLIGTHFAIPFCFLSGTITVSANGMRLSRAFKALVMKMRRFISRSRPITMTLRGGTLRESDVHTCMRTSY